MRTLTRELRDALTPQMAIDVLRKGNERFINNLKANRNLLQQVNETSEGQHPMAVVGRRKPQPATEKLARGTINCLGCPPYISKP